ncbi:MAG: MFS transporter [Pseudomonadota bacterium]
MASELLDTVDPRGFAREAVRDGPVPVPVRVFQALGMIPIALKEFAFTTFVLLFYNQVLGMPASLASAALFVALVVDSISDPLVGSYSDNFRHRLGRRHPLMLVAALPLSIAIWCLFSPPPWQGSALFVWLLTFTVATRLCFTFFAVPWNALFSELSDDYEERSQLLAYRFAVGWIVGISFVYVTYGVIFVATEEYPQGQLNSEAYGSFALLLALLIFAGASATTWLTRGQVRYLRQPTGARIPFDLRLAWRDVRLALRNRDLRILFFAVLASAVVGGTNQALQIYMSTYFWGFSGEHLQFMALAAFGGLFAFLFVSPLQKRFDKKYLLVGAAVVIMLVTAMPVTLRLLELAPLNGSPELIALIVGTAIINSFLGTLALIMFASMVADAVDLQEYETGLRQEGMFNSVMTFSGKLTTGAGVVIAGVLLDVVIGLAPNTTLASIDPKQVVDIGILDAYVVPAFNLVWLFLALQYGISRQRHAQIRSALAARAEVDSGSSPVRGAP